MGSIRAPASVLWRSFDLPVEFLSHLHLSEQPDPAVDSSFKIGTAAQVCSYGPRFILGNFLSNVRPH